ncbi:DNA-binding transcriptional regulator, XRE-family HTH domain [Lachnospiraceae bacterium KH1T2]|nr:DNA-binding transcriptional regulator, XRE-family HTH domain [Lachnospiraceae bacterium KH1T2]
MIDETTVGGRIKRLRKNARLSQDELAEKLHIENRASISSYETNRRLVSGALAVEIANVLGSSTDYILNGTGSEDSFIEEVNELISGVKSDKVKKMILQQLRAAVELDNELF